MRKDPLVGYDLGLLFSVLTLLALGILMVYSASGVRALDALDNPQYYLLLQSAWGAVGLTGMVLAARLDYRRYRALALPLLGLAVVLLVLVLVPGLGVKGGGATRWLRLAGPVALQPAELAKLALVLYFGAWLSARREDLAAGRLALPFALVVGGVAALVVAQPDFGTAVVLVATALGVYFAAGARLREFAVLGVLAFVAVAGLAAAAPYRLARLLTFLDPWADPQGAGFHTVQALYALALGGPLGEGLGAGREKFGFLPAPYTDSIFAVLADELGLVGALAVVLLFGAFVWAGLRIARRAPDGFGALLATGITMWIGLQAWINMAVAASLVPVTGITLPFISYGGSSLVVSLVSVGILLNVGRYGHNVGRYGAAFSKQSAARGKGLASPRSGLRPSGGPEPRPDLGFKVASARSAGKRPASDRKIASR